MDTVYDAKLLIVDDNAELWMTTPSCWHCYVSSCGAQDMAISELPKAAPLPAAALRQSSRS